MDVDEITSARDLDAILPEWWSLYERDPRATPFHSPDWVTSWWKHFGFGKLFVLALREQNQLAGLVPLFIHNFGGNDRRALRQLSPIGIGITDYTDFLFDPQFATEAVQSFYRHLIHSGACWDTADLQGIREGSPLLDAGAPGEDGFKIVPDQLCPFINLPRSPEEFLSSLSSNRRHAYQSARRKLGQLGAVEFQPVGTRFWKEQLEALFTLHQESRQERNLPAGLADPQARLFHREIAEALLRRGFLRMAALRVAGRIASVLYGFSYRSRAFFYQSGFDPRLRKSSPGTVILGCAIEQAIHDGMGELDFLRGNEPYKYAWGARDQRSYRLLF